MQPLALWGPLDVVDPFIEFVVLGLALLNLATRQVAHKRHKRQAEEGAEAMDRFLGHEATNALLVVATFYMLLVEYHGGFIMSLLAVGLVVTDFFEFEARKVEARTDQPIEIPKGAIVASGLVVAYALFQALFFLVEGYWQAVVS
jgi:hypothetical protein